MTNNDRKRKAAAARVLASIADGIWICWGCKPATFHCAWEEQCDKCGKEKQQ